MSKKFTLDIPTELSAITLRQYQKYLKIVKQNEGQEESDFLKMKMIEVFCNVSLEDASNIPVNEFEPLIHHLNALFKEETPLQRDVTVKGSEGGSVQLGFIPDLEQMTMGEFVDLDSYMQDWQDMHKAMAVLYRPMKYKRKDLYVIHEYKASEEYHELMKDMPVNVALGAMVFFYRLGKELATYMMDYSLRQVEMQEAHILKDLEKNGVGINQFMHSLRVMSEELMKLPNSLSNNVLYG
jgi:hypothetical protein